MGKIYFPLVVIHAILWSNICQTNFKIGFLGILKWEYFVNFCGVGLELTCRSDIVKNAIQRRFKSPSDFINSFKIKINIYILILLTNIKVKMSFKVFVRKLFKKCKFFPSFL